MIQRSWALIVLFLGVVLTDKDLRCDLPNEIIEEIQSYAPFVKNISDAVLHGPYKGRTYRTLAEFVDRFGARQAGSQTLENAIDFMVNESLRYGLENVHTEKAEVPYWVRGNESAYLLQPRVKRLSMLGLGSSIGTPSDGITAEAIVVRTFDELKKKASEARGKIVVFAEDFLSYGQSATYRVNGASEASKVGGVACLVRSLTPFSINSPHTGWQEYDGNVTKIPAAAITVEDAELLYRMYHRGQKIVIRIKMEAKNLGTFVSRNTVAELRGRIEPNKTVVISGHLDSWDVGQGAMDDGGGAFISWNALVILKKMGLRPKRTLRAILWTGEEEGVSGAAIYVKQHANESKNLDFVMESDIGTFTPLGLAVSGNNVTQCVVQEVLKLMNVFNATKLSMDSEPGPDIGVWTRQGIPGAGLINANDKYFWFHHSDGDTILVEDPQALDLCTAVWISSSYIIADLDEAIPRIDKPLWW